MDIHLHVFFETASLFIRPINNAASFQDFPESGGSADNARFPGSPQKKWRPLTAGIPPRQDKRFINLIQITGGIIKALGPQKEAVLRIGAPRKGQVTIEIGVSAKGAGPQANGKDRSAHPPVTASVRC